MYNIGVLNERIFPSSGLQSYWRFDETTGTAVADTVGGKNGTISGSTVSYSWNAGKNKNALTTSAIQTGVYCGKTTYAYERTQAWSLSMWYKNNYINNTRFLLSKSANYNKGYEIYFGSDNKIIFHITNTVTTNEAKCTTSTAYNDTTNFHHYVFTYDGGSSTSGMKFYYDGAEVTLTSAINNLSATTFDDTVHFNIGNRGNGNNYGKGIFDETGWWNRVLTLQEAKDIYNLGTGIYY